VSAFIEYKTVGGVRLFLKPIGVAVRQAIITRSEDEFPYPDATPYRRQMENAAEGVLTNPMDDPEFVRLVAEVDQKRERWVRFAIMRASVKLPDYPDEAAVVAAFQDEIEAVRPYVSGFDDYGLALFGSILNWNEDYTAILNLVIQNQKLPLSASEVADGMRLFQYPLPER
jgi:hypothetical protein